MTDIERNSDHIKDSEIIFHFDVDRHCVPVKQFVDTAKSSLAILEVFNKEIFDNKVKFELYVKAPENGGLIEILEVFVLIGGPVWAFTGTDIGKAYIKGLTGKEPAYWAERLGKKTRAKIKKKDDNTMSFMIPDAILSSSSQVDETDKVFLQKADAAILAEIVSAFLSLNTDELDKIGITRSKFRTAFQAKNAIFKACINNQEVKGLGFDRSHKFPLKRKQFPYYVTEVPDAEEVVLEPINSWVVDTPDILVNSPNWNREGRKWQAKTNKFKDIAFTIEDEVFWHHVDVKDIQPDINDNMRVQWAYPAGIAKPTHVRVLKVLSYNGMEISKPLSINQLEDELTEVIEKEDNNLDLFHRTSMEPNANSSEDKAEDE